MSYEVSLLGTIKCDFCDITSEPIRVDVSIRSVDDKSLEITPHELPTDWKDLPWDAPLVKKSYKYSSIACQACCLENAKLLETQLLDEEIKRGKARIKKMTLMEQMLTKTPSKDKYVGKPDHEAAGWQPK
jgi:hypothetical protein